LGHEREIALDDGGLRVLVAVRVGPERAVRDAAQVELLAPREQELALGACPGKRARAPASAINPARMAPRRGRKTIAWYTRLSLSSN
jgi:hypothetical protein